MIIKKSDKLNIINIKQLTKVVCRENPINLLTISNNNGFHSFNIFFIITNEYNICYIKKKIYYYPTHETNEN